REAILTITLPQSTESEKYVIGSMLCSEDVMLEISDMLSKNDFYNEKHKQIFKTIVDNNISDMILLSEKLKQNKIYDEVGGIDNINSMVETVTLARQGIHHANIVKNKSEKRNIIKSFHNLQQKCSEDKESLKDIVSQAEKEILDIDVEESTITILGDGMENVVEMVEGISKGDENIVGIKTGFKSIDNIIDGIKKGEVTVVSGATKVGKSIFALNLAENLSIDRGLHGLYFSYEMMYKYLAYRILLSKAKVASNKIKKNKMSGNDWKRIVKAAENMKEINNLKFLTNLQQGIQTIYRNAKKMKRAGKLDYIIIDHLHLIREPKFSGNRTREVGLIAKGIKFIAGKLNVPIVLVCQMSRGFERRTPPKPKYYDLRDSGEIEQIMAADILLYRPGMYECTAEEDINKIIAITDLNRFGNSGEAKMYLDYDIMKFREYDKFAEF
ncbi:hypothetical protein AKJ59_00825, partial [candidate division MSBL1 archaeon SCGC-AAA385M02]